MRPADEIEHVVKKMSFKAGPEMDKDLWAETLKAQNDFRKTILAPSQHSIGRAIMKSPLTKLAAAAIVAIACVIGLSLWTGTQSGIALADVLARVEKVKAYRYQCIDKISRMDPNEPYSSETRGIRLVSQEYGWKTIYERPDPNGEWSTFKEVWGLPDKKTIIHILHKQKKYSREECDDRWAQEVWKSDNDPRMVTKRMLEYKYKSLGRSTIDAIEVEGFQTNDPNCLGSISGYRKDKVEVDVKMWADVKTRLPVRYEFTRAYFERMGDKIATHEHFVMHDFQWDVPVDAAECVPVIPDDYTGTVVKYPAHITEEIAIQGLKQCVELLGNYPERIALSYRSEFEKSETPAALRLKEELKGLSDEDNTQRLSDATLPIRCLVRFYKLLQWDNKDPAYYGKTVTPKDADKVLMRWKISDNEYRVIYGDLHAETVSPEKLAELEKALPK